MNKYITEAVESLNEFVIKDNTDKYERLKPETAKRIENLNNKNIELNRKNQDIDRRINTPIEDTPVEKVINKTTGMASETLDKLSKNEKVSKSFLNKYIAGLKSKIDDLSSKNITRKAKIIDANIAEKNKNIEEQKRVNNEIEKAQKLLKKIDSYDYNAEWSKMVKKFLINKYQYKPVPERELKIMASYEGEPNRYTCHEFGIEPFKVKTLFSGTIVVDGVTYYVIGRDGTSGFLCRSNTGCLSTNDAARGLIILGSGSFTGTDIALQQTLQHEIGHEQLNVKTKNNINNGKISKRQVISSMTKNPDENAEDYEKDPDKYMEKNGISKLSADDTRDIIYDKLNDLAKEYIADHANASEVEADKYALDHLPPQYVEIAKKKGIDLRYRHLRKRYFPNKDKEKNDKRYYGLVSNDKEKKFEIVGDPVERQKYKKFMATLPDGSEKEIDIYKAIKGEYGEEVKKQAIEKAKELDKKSWGSMVASDVNYRIKGGEIIDQLAGDYYKDINPRKVDRAYKYEDKTSPERKARQEEIARRSAEGYRRREELAKSIKEKENKK